jgi:hypothetical protein
MGGCGGPAAIACFCLAAPASRFSTCFDAIAVYRPPSSSLNRSQSPRLPARIRGLELKTRKCILFRKDITRYSPTVALTSIFTMRIAPNEMKPKDIILKIVTIYRPAANVYMTISTKKKARRSVIKRSTIVKEF